MFINFHVVRYLQNVGVDISRNVSALCYTPVSHSLCTWDKCSLYSVCTIVYINRYNNNIHFNFDLLISNNSGRFSICFEEWWIFILYIIQFYSSISLFSFSFLVKHIFPISLQLRCCPNYRIMHSLFGLTMHMIFKWFQQFKYTFFETLNK